MSALVSMNEVIDELRRAKGKDAAAAVAASIEAGKQRQRANAAEQMVKEERKALNSQWSEAVTSVILTAPASAAAGLLLAEFAHDKVVEQLGPDNVATPFVLPAVGAALAYYGYKAKRLALDERAMLIGGGMGVFAGGLRRSYYDFWSKP